MKGTLREIVLYCLLWSETVSLSDFKMQNFFGCYELVSNGILLFLNQLEIENLKKK